MDIYDALIGGAPTSQDQMQALAAALRKQKTLGSVIGASGDRALAPIGAQLGQDADQQANQIGQAGALEKWRRMQAENTAQNNAMDFQASQARTQEMKDAALERAAVLKLTLDDRARAKSDAADAKVGQQREKYVSQLSSKLTAAKIPQMGTSINQVNTILAKYRDTGDELPGVGFWKNTGPGRMFLSDEGKYVKSSIQAVVNDLLNAYSGLAVTEPETVRRLQEQSLTMFDSPENFKNSWEFITKKYNNIKNGVAGGYNDDVKDQYKKNGGFDLTDVIPAVHPFEGKKKEASGMPEGFNSLTPAEQAEYRSLLGK